MRWLAVLLFGATLLLTTAAASAQPARDAAVTLKPHPAVGVVLPQISCTALGEHDFTAVPDAASRISSAADPDLSAFRAHGGKLIIYQGWADQAIPPFSTIDYYAAVEKTMGGFASTQGFSRLYMVPGGYHCLGGGDPAVTANFLTR
ncbi:MAG: tannase/feruloyl esterase family alpha/beta hydrolase [Streptosporangiaceae bacterium]